MIGEVVDVGLALAMAVGAIGGWLIRRIIARSDSHDRRLGNLEINSARHHERLLALEREVPGDAAARQRKRQGYRILKRSVRAGRYHGRTLTRVRPFFLGRRAPGRPGRISAAGKVAKTQP